MNAQTPMMIRSPFDGLRIPRELVCEFFAVFSRFEYTLKEQHHVQKQNTYASPDWDSFAKDASAWLRVEAGSDLAAAVAYLNDDPPQVQTPALCWEKRPLGGKTPIEKALHAVCRVRNNLFHGGKHTAHSPAARDEQLVHCSLTMLTACLQQNENLRAVFEQIEF
jgi:hypothetical protein